jgi:hypothetical protein
MKFFNLLMMMGNRVSQSPSGQRAMNSLMETYKGGGSKESMKNKDTIRVR